MRKKRTARRAQSEQKAISEVRKLPTQPHSASDEVERAFWWMVFGRRDFLTEKIEAWERDSTGDLATKEHRLAMLHTLLNEIEELIGLSSRNPTARALLALKRWHSGSTKKQQECWIPTCLSTVPNGHRFR